VLLIFTFQGENLIPETLKNSDSGVLTRFESGGGWDKLWELFEKGDPLNPFYSKAEMIAKCPIV
jgi:hypothetical protein